MAETTNVVRAIGLFVSSSRAKNVYERRVTVSERFGPWVWREVQAQLVPSAPPDSIQELELYHRTDGRFIISIGLLNPRPDPRRLNTRISFVANAWVCGDAFMLAKEYQEPFWVTRSFTKQEWEHLTAVLKAVAGPNADFLDAEPCTEDAFVVRGLTHMQPSEMKAQQIRMVHILHLLNRRSLDSRVTPHIGHLER